MVRIIKALILRFIYIFLITFNYTPQVAYYYIKNLIRWWPSVLDIIKGEQTHPGGIYAIFVMWQPKKTPWYVWNALDALAETGVNVLLVVNHPLTEDRLKELKARCHTIMLRDNTGADIGGYKDASQYLKEDITITRVIYLNDSVYYFKKRLKELFSRLARDDADVCSAFENVQIHYHFQSFCLSVSGELFRHSNFQRFWKRYLPANIRRWAINRGEVGLTKQAIIPIAKTINIIYKVDELRKKLEQLSSDELLLCERQLPIPLRKNFNNIGYIPATLMPAEITFKIAAFSQIHSGAFLFMTFAECPLMKRDLIFRDLYMLHEVEYFLRQMDNHKHIPEIMTDMRKKGSGQYLGRLDRWKFRFGMI